nr:uncharacterized protein CTRU02_14083 [Colletotrichum truncatum]KAF6782602.1 hypothetical protein CTRU02_14083 [Colletotrichum truncatum]
MHIPTFGQVATLGMAFFAATALAVPIAEPLEADLAERSADIAARSEGFAAIAGADVVARSVLEDRNSKKKCKRTNNKGYCSDSDDDKKKKKQCKRNSKGYCSDSDDDKKNKKKKQCKRNSKGDCSDSDDDKKGGNKGYNKGYNKDDKKGNKKGHYRREEGVNSDFEDLE